MFYVKPVRSGKVFVVTRIYLLMMSPSTAGRDRNIIIYMQN